mmetsp:Transcript_29405/g.36332  ORF Transcript_29405/g.36332 Transcript_29405/m.36332 type:complete len:84 (+) Transcript_29405:423-674(+)
MAPNDCTIFFETTRGGRGHSDFAKSTLKSFVAGYTSEDKPSYHPGDPSPAASLKLIDKVKQLVLGILFVFVHLVAFYYFTVKK